jgi:hypothetical protein
MRKADAYPSRYFKATNFPDDWELTVEVEMARFEDFQNGDKKTEKLVVYFRKQKSGLVVGPTVWDQFIEATGEEDCDDWKQHRVTLYRDTTPFQGKTVPCIRVRKPEMAPAKKPSRKAAPKQEEQPEFDDEIPFK